jgi:hypothetical protein
MQMVIATYKPNYKVSFKSPHFLIRNKVKIFVMNFFGWRKN